MNSFDVHMVTCIQRWPFMSMFCCNWKNYWIQQSIQQSIVLGSGILHFVHWSFVFNWTIFSILMRQILELYNMAHTSYDLSYMFTVIGQCHKESDRYERWCIILAIIHHGKLATTDDFWDFRNSTSKDSDSTKTNWIIMVSMHMYRILPNKWACLNNRTPNFWLHLATSQKPLNQSESNFQQLLLRYSFPSPHSKFHWNLIRVRAHSLLPRPVYFFGEIRYVRT